MTSAQQHQHNEELIRAAEQHLEQYLRSLRALHDGLAPSRRDRADSRTNTIAASITIPRPRRDTLETSERPSLYYPSPRPRALSGGASDLPQLPPDDELAFIPLLDGSPARTSYSPPSRARQTDSPVVVDADITPRVSRPLTRLSFTDDHLLRHLRDHDFSEFMSRLLEEALRRRDAIDPAASFRDFAEYEGDGYVSATIETYDVAPDATTRKTSLDGDALAPNAAKYSMDGPLDNRMDVVDASTIWDSIKDVNIDGSSVGRITIVQEPTPLTLAALHLAMSPHFDTYELMHHLLADSPNRGRTHAFMHRAFERTPSIGSDTTRFPTPHSHAPPVDDASLRQRSFLFVFKYYTVVAQDLQPAPWQRHDKRPPSKRPDDHIDIAECGSVLALSLGGEPIKPLRMRQRKERTHEGFLFDTFGPWHLLSIQSYPDEQHTVRGEEFQSKSFYNGPYAFLDLLVAEYRDAVKRNQLLHDRITTLITPPAKFMFDRDLRDELLFEDKHFTYIRRYFWAYNTLGVINNGIKAMIAAYVEAFPDDFWAGTHPRLWPHPDPASPEGIVYRERMAVLRRELDKVVGELGEVLNSNVRTRKEIENLRDQLFNGSSIKESRKAVDQGDNILILTMISMIFLPLTFVTSVFGITQFTIPVSDWRFPVTMVLVCVPFMALVLFLQLHYFALLVRKLSAAGSYILFLPLSLISRFREPDVADNRSTAPVRRRRRLVFARKERAGRKRAKWPWGPPRDRRDAAVDEIDMGRV